MVLLVRRWPVITGSSTGDPVPGNHTAAVTLTAAGDAATYTWELGDGATAEGRETPV